MSISKPGCFGISTVCQSNKKICKQCPVESDCLGKSQAVMREVQKITGPSEFSTRLGLSAATTSARSEEISEEELKLLSTLSGKPKQIAETLCKRGINLKICLETSVNPLSGSKPLFISHSFDFLLSRQSFAKSELQSYLAEQDSSWGHRTVASHVSSALRVFEAFGCIRKAGFENFKVSKNDNT